MDLRRCSEIAAAGDAEAALPLTPGERAAGLPQARPLWGADCSQPDKDGSKAEALWSLWSRGWEWERIVQLLRPGGKGASCHPQCLEHSSSLAANTSPREDTSNHGFLSCPLRSMFCP